MFFEDLTPYSYNLPRNLDGVLNVGWLEAGHAYQRGEVTAAFALALKASVPSVTVGRMRGFHTCDLCEGEEQRQSFALGETVVWLGAAELWMPGPDGTIFASPNLIVHYVESHAYRPPDSFVEAVLGRYWRSGWHAQSVYDRLTLSAYE